MGQQALVTDYDGTLARQGLVDPGTVAALRRWRASGGRLVLVTGRTLDDLRAAFPDLGVADLVVAENGGLLHRPDDGQVIPLAPGPHPALVSRLRREGVAPLSVGAVVVATTTEHEQVVQQAVHDLRLGCHLERNRRALMILPQGVDKASGVDVALRALALRAGDAVGIGDAENDLSFLRLCGRAVAVADALPAVRAAVAQVTAAGAGSGVVELVETLLAERPG